MSLRNIIDRINWKTIEFNINLPLVVFYLNYIIYGFYGSNTGGNLINQLFVTLTIIVFHLCLGHISSLKYSFLSKKISFKPKEVLIFLGILFFISLISSDYLFNSLEGDEFSFLQLSVVHGLEASHIISEKLSFFSNISFKYLVHTLSAFFLLFNAILILFTLRLSPIKRTIVILFFLILFRAVIFFIGGGNNSPHPPLSLLPSFLTFSTFGASSFFIKLGYQLVFGIYLFFLLKKIQIRLNTVISILIILFVGTIPVLNRLSTTLTPSLFTFIVFSYLLIYFSFNKEKNYYFIFFLIAVGSMFRLPTLIIIVPSIILFLKDNFSSLKFDKRLIILFSPFLITLPFLIRTFLEGTPATNFSSSSIGLIDKVLYAFETRSIFVSALNSIDIWSLALFPFAFILLPKKIFSFNNLIFFCVCLIVYYSIKIELWGLAKYQVEFIIPFIIIGLINICNQINSSRIKYIFNFLLFSLIALNLNSVFQYPTNNKNWEKYLKQGKIKTSKLKKESSGVIRPVYNVYPAYEYVKSSSLSGKLLSLNNDYGIMPEIINGFKSNEISKIKKNSVSYNQFLEKSSNKDSIKIINFLNNNPNIQVLILSNWNDERSDIFIELINNDWSIAKEFQNLRHNSVTYVLAK